MTRRAADKRWMVTILRSQRGLIAALVLVGAIAVQFAPAQSRAQAQPQDGRRPDIILIITDDQRSDTMQYMPLTTGWLPTGYPQAFVSNPSCCPSRTTILTSAYSQSNGVWSNGGPYGGWPAFVANGWPGRTIADSLHGDGYRTALYGKFLNGWDGTIPPGWDEFASRVSAGVYPRTRLAPYYDYTLREATGSAVTDVHYGDQPQDYSTSVIRQMATDFIRSTPVDQPLFLYFAPAGPHSAGGGQPPIPAPLDMYAPVSLDPDFPNVGEDDVTDKPAYIAQRRKLTATRISDWRTRAARTLMSVDRAIDDIMTTIEATRDLSNTLVLFISDNGFEIGSHRWKSKNVPYEEAIRVPMRARFDGRLPTGDQAALVDNLDMAPTIADAAGISFPSADGQSLLGPIVRDYLVIQGGVGGGHAFCGVRAERAKYVKYASGEEEFYNLVSDPYELSSDPSAPGAGPLRQLAQAVC
jgi:N-acetylglucosamine-6-sulfatase